MVPNPGVTIGPNFGIPLVFWLEYLQPWALNAECECGLRIASDPAKVGHRCCWSSPQPLIVIVGAVVQSYIMSLSQTRAADDIFDFIHRHMIMGPEWLKKNALSQSCIENIMSLGCAYLVLINVPAV